MKLLLSIVGIFIVVSLFACEEKDGQETATEETSESQTEQSEEQEQSEEETSETSE